ncbi:Chemotaxis protein methyltransferase CheR [hydrothermal vent metagenome]|uniref:protein-glutamate O-methyltransferase n=1 Tax=hydrothermal vent metagenome TaxID=652676 RepID=A0A3B1AXC4_9ZZZZ
MSSANLARRERVSQGEREFVFTDGDFEFIRQLVAEKTGIVLNDAKRNLVYSRLSRRLRQLGQEHFSDYCNLLKAGDDGELVNFTNAITTNLTSFFRENHHFDYLRDTLLPELMQDKADRRLRCWSAGCSTGEEPYSIAMVLRETLPEKGWDVRLLATDLDSDVVAKAQCGIYTQERVNGISPKRLRRWFLRGKADNDGMVQVRPPLRELIAFRQLNLMQEWPISGPLDFIFCRNVVIYFDKPTQKVLFDRYAELLPVGGHLFIGHSESLFKVSDRFKLIGKTIYRKVY